MPLRQYRACVVDSLGVGITCVLYHSSMCTRHPNLVSSAFYAIPIFHIIILIYLFYIDIVHLSFMPRFGFKQLVNSPTTPQGTLIDHVYYNDRQYSNIVVHVLDTVYCSIPFTNS